VGRRLGGGGFEEEQSMGLRGRAIAAVLFGLVSVALPVGAAEQAAWDPQRATDLATRFEAAIRGLIEDPGLESPQTTAMQERQHQAAVLDVRRLAGMAEELARKLRSGRGYDQTRPIVEAMEQLRGSVREYARDSRLSKSAQEKARSAANLLTELSRLYGLR